MQLTDLELETYSRQLLVRSWGLKQQLNLKKSNVLIKSGNEISARYLIAAGLGSLTITNNELHTKLMGYELHTKLLEYDNSYSIYNYDYIIDENDNDNQILSGLLTAAKCIQVISSRE